MFWECNDCAGTEYAKAPCILETPDFMGSEPPVRFCPVSTDQCSFEAVPSNTLESPTTSHNTPSDEIAFLETVLLSFRPYSGLPIEAMIHERISQLRALA
jgi:hypothetical protein